jgi:hypothetical protein
VWEHMWRAALAALDQQGQLDVTMAFLDGWFASARNGGGTVGLTKMAWCAGSFSHVRSTGRQRSFPSDRRIMAETMP